MPQVSSVGLTPTQVATLQAIVNSNPAASAAYFGTSSPVSSSGGGSSSSYSAPTQTTTNYSVKSGDTLSSIAAAKGTTVSAIMAANPSITDANKIYAGNSIVIPSTATNQNAVVSTTTTPTTTPATTNTTPATSSLGSAVVGTMGTWFNTSTNQGYSGPKQNLSDVPADPTTGKPILPGITSPATTVTTPVTAANTNTYTNNQQTTNTNQSNAGTTQTNTNQTNTGSITGNPELDAILKGFQDTIDLLVKQGKKITVKDITPAMAAQWANDATSLLSPYYQQQYRAIQADVNSNFDILQKQYDLAVADKAATFRQNLGLQQQTEAEKGTTFSGNRLTREQNIAESSQRDLNSLLLSNQSTAQNLGNTTERNIGSLNMGGITIPKLNTYKTSLEGGGTLTPRTTASLYTPVGGITGSLENELAKYKKEYTDTAQQNWLNSQNI